MSQIVDELEKGLLKTDLPQFNIGDTLRISTRIVEGKKERIQDFEGTLIAHKGSGLGTTITLHRVAYKEGMERVFMVHSPRIVSIKVTRRGKVRRAKLYYLRGTKGKASKVKGLVN